MIAKLYIPYSNGDCVNGFVYDKGDISEKEYASMMVKVYNRYRDGIDSTMRTSFTRNIAINPFEKEHNEYKQQTYKYIDIDCKVYSIDGQSTEIDELIEYYRSGEPFILTINIPKMKDDPDLETDMRQWSTESYKINNSRRLTEEEKIKGLSKKDLKISFKNSRSSAILRSCKMVDTVNNNTFAFLIEKIIFIKEER